MTDDEPLIHSHHTDVLDKSHPWADKTVICGKCGTMVHAFNNECMTTWLEWDKRALCGECAAPIIAAGVLEYADFIEAASHFTSAADPAETEVKP
jgi:hypothetical protein